MSVISSSNNTIFKDSSIVISNVKRFLKSYNAFDLLNIQEFHRYISDITAQLGLGVLKEDDALVYIEGSKGLLPDNFKSLYAAYKTTPFFSHEPIDRLQSNSFSMTRDVTQELIASANRCEIECCENNVKIVERITVKNYVTDSGYMHFGTPILLTLSPNVKPIFIEKDSPSLNHGGKDEITIDERYMYTNFDHDVVYIKYYGTPMDKITSLPMIPDIKSVEKAIEWYIIYQTLLGLWYNSEVPDLQNKFQQAKQEYEFWFAEALHERKLPTFQALVEKMRLNRGNLRIYQMDTANNLNRHS